MVQRYNKSRFFIRRKLSIILPLFFFMAVALSIDKRVNALRREVLIEERMWVLMRFTEEKSHSTVTDVCGIVSKILSSWWMLGKMSQSATLKISKRVNSVGIGLLRNDLKTSILHSRIVNPYPPATVEQFHIHEIWAGWTECYNDPHYTLLVVAKSSLQLTRNLADYPFQKDDQIVSGSGRFLHLLDTFKLN